MRQNLCLRYKKFSSTSYSEFGGILGSMVLEEQAVSSDRSNYGAWILSAVSIAQSIEQMKESLHLKEDQGEGSARLLFRNLNQATMTKRQSTSRSFHILARTSARVWLGGCWDLLTTKLVALYTLPRLEAGFLNQLQVVARSHEPPSRRGHWLSNVERQSSRVGTRFTKPSLA